MHRPGAISHPRDPVWVGWQAPGVTPETGDLPFDLPAGLNRPVWDDGPDLGLGSLDGPVEADLCVVGLGGSGLSAIGEALAAGRSVVGIDAATVGATKPVVAVLLGARDGPIRPGSAVPGFAFPEVAAAVLGRSWAYGHWLQTEAAAKPEVITDVDADAVNTVLAGAIAAGQPLLDVDDTLSVLTSYGIAMPPTLFVAADDAVAAAEEVGYPVAVKARRRHVGRSLKAGVALDLTDTADVVDSVRVMREELGEHADAMVVQAMTAPGVDLRIRASLDERLGPLVAIGVGGFGSDLLADEKVRLAPLSAESAHALISESRAGAALQQAEIGTGLLVDTLIRAAQLAADHPEFVDIDLNPVITTSDSCCVTDAIIRISPVDRPEGALRRL